MIFKANCKINLGLDVLGRRSDGFHEVQTVLFPVRGLFDVLEIERTGGSGVVFRTEGLAIDCPGEENLCLKAYRLMHERYGVDGVSISLDKRKDWYIKLCNPRMEVVIDTAKELDISSRDEVVVSRHTSLYGL